MKFRRIKLVWGATEVIRGRWYFGLFGLYDRLDGEREGGLAISMRGALGWSLALLVAAYVAGAGALFSFWQRNPYCLLTYGDAFFYPARRAEVAAKKGQAFIAEGQELLKARKWFDAERLLRQGLAHYPRDMRARLALANFCLMTNRRAESVKLLSEGLAEEFPGRSYLQSFFDLAEQGDDHDRVVTTVDRYLPLLKGDRAAVERRWLVARKFAALVAAQRRAEALALAESEEPGEMAGEHRVLALLELGRAAEAVAFLAQWEGRPGADLRVVRRLQARACRDAGRPDEMERALEELRALTPADPRQAIYGIVQRALAGRDEAASAALGDYLFRFGGSPGNLELAAQPLAEIGNRALFERCVAAATERGYPLQSFRALQVQLHVQRGEWAEAARVLALMKPAGGRTAVMVEQSWLDWMERLMAAVAAPAEAAQGSLLEFLRGRPWPMSFFKQSIGALRRAGRRETARDVIALAEAAFPKSGWVQAQKSEVARELAAQRAAEPPVGAVVVPPVLERLFFERLDAFMGEQQWEPADRLMREVRTRQPPPGWLEKRDGDLRFAEVRINQGRGEMPAMLAAARLYLNGDAERARRMCEAAREYFAAGDKAGATMLVQAVLQRTPDHPLAKRLLAEWTPRPAAAAK